MKTSVRFAFLYALVLVTSPQHAAAQGPLAPPPGAPSPTMKTLQQIEPRTPITNLPHTVSQPGSYYLTTNLVSTTTFNGITIASSGVTLDLMGFELVGFDFPAGGSGIHVDGVRSNIVIRNGTIRNWRTYGISALTAHNSEYHHLRILANTLGGIRCGSRSLISHCRVFNNLHTGIWTETECVIEHCTVSENAQSGIVVDFASVIRHCTLISNAVDGVVAKGDGILENNYCAYNVGDGIRVTSTKNVVSGNLFTRNGRGLRVGSFGNLIYNNRAVSSVSGVNYSIEADNKVGVIVSTPNSGGIGGNSGGVGLGTTDPWANFSF